MYPAATVIAPLLGVIASLCGSPTIFKVASSFNATCVAINYPATIIYMLCIKENLLYIIIMSVLLVNKILLSYFGGKVRSNFLGTEFCVFDSKENPKKSTKKEDARRQFAVV